jgi:hypothetical protein
MATITFRTDAAVDSALEDLNPDGRDRSAVIRDAILAAAKITRRERMRQQAIEVASDPEDVAEMRRIRAEMDALSAEG